MIFAKPDPETVRISDCGRFLIVRHSTLSGPRYQLWHYQLARGGFESAQEAQGAAQHIWDSYDRLDELDAVVVPQNSSNSD